jgi:hypothetical protein
MHELEIIFSPEDSKRLWEYLNMGESLTEKYRDRHFAVLDVLKFLEPNQNLRQHLLDIAVCAETMADKMMQTTTEDSPELTAGLRKLLEAKDCFIRANL